MGELQMSDMQRLLDCVAELHACRDLSDFPQLMLRVLPKLVRSKITSYTEVDVANGRATAVMDTDEFDLEKVAPVLIHYQDQHPLIARFKATGDGTAIKISDLLPLAEYHLTGVYNDLYGPMDCEDQMAITLPTRLPKIIGVVVNRERIDFSEKDRLLLNMIRPHIIQAFEHLQLRAAVEERARFMQSALEQLDEGVIRLSSNGRPTYISPRAQQWLSRYFPAPRAQGHLPEMIERWLVTQRLSASREHLPGVRSALVLELNGDRLEIRRIESSDGQDLLILELQSQHISPKPLEQLGLTPREAEVLFWIAQGKTNPEIGIILGAKPRTVQKHVERILVKLHVENRISAAMRAAEHLRGMR